MGKRSQSRLQMGAAILGKLYEQLWRGVGPARILIIRRSGGGVLLHALGIIVDAAQTTFIHSTCLTVYTVLFFSGWFYWMMFLYLMLPRVTLKQPRVSGVFLYLHLNCLARSGD